MTSLTETIICMMLFAWSLTMLLSLMSFATGWHLKSQEQFSSQLDEDFFIDSLQQDIKSCDEIIVTQNSIQATSAETVVSYQLIGGAIYRNSEVALTGVEQTSFGELDGDTLQVYIEFTNGDLIDTTVHR